MTKQLDLFAVPEAPKKHQARGKDSPTRGVDPRTPQPYPSLVDQLPDVRDGLTREQRVILYSLYEAEKEQKNTGRRIPTLTLYGRVCERLPMTPERFQALLSQLVGRGVPPL